MHVGMTGGSWSQTTLATGRKQLRGANVQQALSIAASALGAGPVTRERVRTLTLREAILACGGSEQGLDEALKSVPDDVKRAAAQIVSMLPYAHRRQVAAMEKLKDLGDLQPLATESLAFAHTYDPGPHGLALMDRFDVSPYIQSGFMLARAVESSGVRNLRNRPFNFSWPTPLGRIELAGGQGNRHDTDGAALIIETGDKAEFTGKGAVMHSSVIIADGRGNSFNECGLAVFGVSEIFAYGGHNNYTCADAGIGATAFGVSTVVDGGDSSFECKELGEGAAVQGVGLLLNLGRNNRYKCRSLAQGFGGPKGFGALVDAHGESTFDADDTKIDNPSPQTAQHNVSLAQGAGFGRRDDPGTGHSMAGGVGILVNGGSNNRYSCGVFGQGVAYWYSLGALVNFGSGNTYKGVWYVQGSAAHYALACMLSFGGGDHFEATMAQSDGQGHDYSIGLLRSFKGGNEYKGAGGAFGSGRWNGMGLFATEGRNTFEAGGESYGFAADHRPAEGCFGFFASPGPTVFKGAAKEVAAGKSWFFQNVAKPAVIGAGHSGR